MNMLAMETKNTITDLEIKWAARLLTEHKNICYEHKIYDLATPLINISGSKNIQGSWDPESGTISISRRLIQTQPWHIVVEIFKHEIAHQYVSIKYNDADIHGGCFKKACEKLGVHPVFQKSSGDLHKDLQSFKGELPKAAQKMLNKVEKLMALGQSSNEKEAQAASRKANFLLNKYNLEQINTQNSSDIKYSVICHKKKRIESIQRAILAVLRNYYYMDSVTSYAYDQHDNTGYRSLVLIGNRETLKVAEYVYYFLFDTAQRLWQEYRKKKKAKRGDKVAFDMGFIKGIRNNHEAVFKKTELKINETSTSLPVRTLKDLMVQAQKENKKETSRLFPKLTNVRYGRCVVSSSAYKEGFKNGKNTVINKSMTTKGVELMGLLEN
jgi:hypothetical protein